MVDTTPSYYQAAKYAAKITLNKHISKESALIYAKNLELTGDSLNSLKLTRICKEVDESVSFEFLDRWAEAFDGSTTQLLYPISDAKEVLSTFAKRYHIAVVSQRHQPHSWLKNKLKELGLIDFVDCCITRLDVNEGKPNPEGIFLAQAQLQAKPILSVGDALNDIIAGQKAGITTVGVATGLTSYSELITSGADIVFSTLTKVIHWFEAEYETQFRK